MRFNIVVSLI